MKNTSRHLFHISLGIIGYLFLCYLLLLSEVDEIEANIQSFQDAIWYGLVTLTTVGYGDFYPTTLTGKMIGGLFVLGSLGVLSYLISQLTNSYQNYMEKKKQGYYGTNFTNHHVLIGWNSFAQLVGTEIYNSEKQLAIITNNKEKITSIETFFPNDNVFVLFNDYNQFSNYSKANIENAKSIFINFEDDTKTLVFIINLKKYFTTLPKIIVALENAELKDTYQQIGVECTIATQNIASKLVASYIFEPDVALFTEDLIQTSVKEDDCDIIEVCIKKEHSICNQNYFDLFVELKRQCNVTLIGIARQTDGIRRIIKNPNQEERVLENDCLIVINDKKGKERMKKYMHDS